MNKKRKLSVDDSKRKSYKITSIRIANSINDSPKVIFDKFYSIFALFFTIIGFEDDPKAHVISIKMFCIVVGKVFLFFCTFLHLINVISSLVVDHSSESIELGNEFLVSINSFIQTLIWYRNRKYFRKIFQYLWRNHFIKSIDKNLTQLRIFLMTGFFLVCVLFVTVFTFSYKVFYDDMIYIKTCFFGLTVSDIRIQRFLSFIVNLTWAWIPLKVSSFVLYYSCLCRILQGAIKEFISKIETENDFSRLLQMHWKITDDVLLVENHFSGHLGIVCWLSLYELFSYEYLIIKRHTFLPHRCIIIAWYAAVLLCFLLTASFVNESLDEVKNSINYRNVLKSSCESTRLVLNVCFTDVKLTIWKILPIRRMTILSILGTFITYSYLIMS